MISITGHTSGLGKALFDRYHPSAIGFSRANGYDISDADSRKLIAAGSSDCLVFVNNAHCGFHQIDMLYEMHAAWQDLDRLIVNISSNSGDGIKPFPHRYAVQKSALDKASQQLSRLSSPCRVINIRPGYMDTPRVKDIVDQPKLELDQVVDVIAYLLSIPANICPAEITLLPRRV